MDDPFARRQPGDLDAFIEPLDWDERLIFDPVDPAAGVQACGKCGKCGKSAGREQLIEDDLNELRRHIYRNPEILRDIMERWNIEPTVPRNIDGGIEGPHE